MLFSRDWLAEYVELPDSNAEIAAALTAIGLAVDGVEPRGVDTIFDVDVTTNRPDAMNHIGLARELAVKLGRPLRLPRVELRESAAPAADAAAVAIEAGSGGLRYAARVVRGVRVAPSPGWLVARLEAIGHRPINNIVDITNFVLWETGQPLHAFDLDRLAGSAAGGAPEIVVRRARPGESLVTLDHVERRLHPDMLVIADAARPIGLAGVMGGLDSEVTARTTAVLIESAHFERARVRSTARALGLKTDASHRFERGADPEGCVFAADRAAALIAAVAGGDVLGGVLDVRADWPRDWPPRGAVARARLNAFAGVEYTVAEIEAVFAGLGFGIERIEALTAECWRLTVPSWRWYDIPARPETDGQTDGDTAGETEEADLFEEVIRHGGFDRIPAALPAIPGRDEGRAPAHDRRGRVRAALVAAGYAEAIHFAFHSREAAARFPSLLGAGEPLALENPISEIYAVLRRSLLAGLFEGARFNQARHAPAVQLFEVGHVFRESGPELEALAWIGGEAGMKDLRQPDEIGFLESKRAIEAVLAALGVAASFRPADLAGLEPGSGAEIWAGDLRIGYLGRISGVTAPFPLYGGEVLLDGLPVAPPVVRVALPSRYPEVVVDLTLTHALDTPWAEIDQSIRAHSVAKPGGELARFDLHDRYRGDGVPAGAVATTIRFHYNAEDRSLTLEEVNTRHRELAAELQRRFGLQESPAP